MPLKARVTALFPPRLFVARARAGTQHQQQSSFRLTSWKSRLIGQLGQLCFSSNLERSIKTFTTQTYASIYCRRCEQAIKPCAIKQHLLPQRLQLVLVDLGLLSVPPRLAFDTISAFKPLHLLPVSLVSRACDFNLWDARQHLDLSCRRPLLVARPPQLQPAFCWPSISAATITGAFDSSEQHRNSVRFRYPYCYPDNICFRPSSFWPIFALSSPSAHLGSKPIGHCYRS